MSKADLYKPQFVRSLFNEMAETYGVVNMISSLGFACRWRRQCVKAIEIATGSNVLDLMAGMGEACQDLVRQIGETGRITTIDISHTMCRMALNNGALARIGCPVHVIEADALDCPLTDNAFDAVVSVFGLKTFNEEQTRLLAAEVNRVLKPGGQFSFLEISIPQSKLLRIPYLFYLKFVIPIIGRLFMGNADNYRLLSVYTEAFGNCRAAQSIFKDMGLIAEYRTRFFGCATLIYGRKPAVN